jgi:RecQ family ATP-dependent DNA helicase
MRRFIAQLDALAAALDALGDAPGDAARVDAGELALAALRRDWAALDPAARAAFLPAARLLAERLEALRRAPAVPVSGANGGTPADPDGLLAAFGHGAFRPGQREIVDAALAGRDTLVVMPTGGGKSLCYQLPGIAGERLTLVISPLIALIADQCRRLRAAGHPAVMLTSLAGEDENRAALADIRDGRARIAYAAPERFASRAFLDALATRELDLVAVDEAHCIAEWGHDFRPDYLRLREAIERVGRPPVMALTATATPEVEQEIRERLGLRDPIAFRGGFDRPNLSFDVIMLGGKGALSHKRTLLLAGLAREDTRPAIVYCGTRKDVEAVCELLREQGIAAVRYHAGLGDGERGRAQAAFMGGEAEVVCATNAFGMGIDRADVRSVWHWALPTSIEAYYQEAGRAGRDGLPARAVLLALRADLGRLIRFNAARTMDADTVRRHHQAIVQEAGDQGRVTLDAAMDDERRLALSILERTGTVRLEPAGGGRLGVVATGPFQTAKTGALARVARDRGWRAYRAIEAFSSSTDRCHRRQILDHFGDGPAGPPVGRCCSVCDPIDWLPDPAAVGAPSPAGASRAAADVEARLEGPAAETLKAWRLERAEGRPAYTVCSNATLAAIAGDRPASATELGAIRGIGPSFLERHAASLLELLPQLTD